MYSHKNNHTMINCHSLPQTLIVTDVQQYLTFCGLVSFECTYFHCNFPVEWYVLLVE